MKKIRRQFYERQPIKVANDLLGKYIVHINNEGKTTGKIVETEAYTGVNDPASHTYKGRCTERTKLLFGPAGYVYVYLIYGMYLCLNIVVGEKNMPGSVFIRAIEPIEGSEIMKKRRRSNGLTGKNLLNLTNGPGKLCEAMGITRDLYGEDICGDKIFILEGEKINSDMITATARVNIDYAGEAKQYPWRFIIKDSKFLSKV